MFLVNTIYYKASYVLTTSYVLANALEKVDEISVNNLYWQTGNWGQYVEWLSTGLHSDGEVELRVKPGSVSSLRPLSAPPFGPKIVYHQCENSYSYVYMAWDHYVVFHFKLYFLLAWEIWS